MIRPLKLCVSSLSIRNIFYKHQLEDAERKCEKEEKMPEMSTLDTC